MKLTVTQENLSRALQTVSKTANARGSLPILANVLLKTVDNQLLVAATNLDLAVNETIGAKIKQTGSVTVPARLMQDYVSSLPASTLTLEAKDNKLQLTTDHHSSTINGTSAEDFPVMPTIEKGKTLTFQVGEFKDALQQVLFAASHDESRPVLSGLLLHTENDTMYAVATDSYRLSEKVVRKAEKEEVSLLLPSTSLQETLRILDNENDDLEIVFDEQQARIRAGSRELVTRLIEGNYPAYRKLLPSKSDTTAVLSRGDLQEITKVSSLFAREAAGGITLSIDEEKQEVSIQSIASQVGENNAVASAKISGDATITLNSRYLLDALNVMQGENVAIGINGKLEPCLLTDPDNNDITQIVMPVKS